MSINFNQAKGLATDRMVVSAVSQGFPDCASLHETDMLNRVFVEPGEQ